MANYRIFRVCSSGLYTRLYQDVYDEYELAKYTYDEAMRIIRSQGLIYPSSFKDAMQELGNEVVEAVVDFMPLQQQWLRDHAADETAMATTTQEIFLAQLKATRPDIVYFQELDVIPASLRARLRELVPSIRLVTGFKGFPPADFNAYRDIDIVFISYPAYQAQWAASGIATHDLPHCFDPGTAPLPTLEKKYDFSFIGSSGYGNSNQAGRYHDLRQLLERTNLEVWGLEPRLSRTKLRARELALTTLGHTPAGMLATLRQQSEAFIPRLAPVFRDAQLIQDKRLDAHEWYIDAAPLHELFPERVHAPQLGRAYLALLGQSRITLNRHTDKAGESGNIRTFEATGMGTCLLTDQRPQLGRLFEPDREIVMYQNIDDCIAKATYLLNHPAERKAIAQRAQVRVRRDHTTRHRGAVINQVLQQALAA